MDVVLERILSLLPCDENGKIVRGAKKDFAQSIGYDSGDIVSMWIKGTSLSYKNKLHEIAAKYHVSVEWLQGKTEDKSIKETPDPKPEMVIVNYGTRQLPKMHGSCRVFYARVSFCITLL